VSVDILVPLLGVGGTLLLVVIGLLNFTVFLRQLRLAKEQIQTALKQLELAQEQPEIQLIQRAIAETSDPIRVLVEKPHLRPYFYENKSWQEGDKTSHDEVKTMAELFLHNFASAIMRAASFPQYPVGGIDRIIMFHLQNSPALRAFLFGRFDRFPLTGLTLLCFKNNTRAEVEEDLQQLIAASAKDEEERERRKELLHIFQNTKGATAFEFTKHSMEKRRGHGLG